MWKFGNNLNLESPNENSWLATKITRRTRRRRRRGESRDRKKHGGRSHVAVLKKYSQDY